jgi:hypothetical protein
MSVMIARGKLVAVLGMMGSDHDGEALAAARAAERLRRQIGATWSDLLQAPEPPPVREGWRDVLSACRASDKLSEWEQRFLDVLSAYEHEPSARQRQILAQIAAKAGAACQNQAGT